LPVPVPVAIFFKVKKKSPLKKRSPRKIPVPKREEAEFLKSLQTHGRVLECDDDDAPLPPGVTHILVRKLDDEEPVLTERRKSFI
jgi:hypothetical protein